MQSFGENAIGFLALDVPRILHSVKNFSLSNTKLVLFRFNYFIAFLSLT